MNMLKPLFFIFFYNFVTCLIFYNHGFNRSLLNVDIVIFTILTAFVHRYISFLFLFVVCLFEFLNLTLQVFYFDSFSDFLYLIKFFPNLSNDWWVMLFIFFSVFFLFVLISSFCCYAFDKLLVLIFCNFLVFFMVLGSVIYTGLENSSNKLISSSFERLLSEKIFSSKDLFNDKENSIVSPYDGMSLMSKIEKELYREKKILFIISESLGISDSVRINEKVFHIKGFPSHEVTYGSFDFKGFTVKGEFRELCGKEIETINVLSLNASAFSLCIPDKLRDNGYSTISYHAASKKMYDRYMWYGSIGIEQSYFLENLDVEKTCFSFPGGCDVDIFSELSNQFDGDDKKFIYWLTLNTHSTYDLRDLEIDNFDCVDFNVINQEYCRNVKLHEQFFRNLSVFLLENKDVFVAVVGDHEPPVINKNRKGSYFEEGKVAFLILKPKNSGN